MELIKAEKAKATPVAKQLEAMLTTTLKELEKAHKKISQNLQQIRNDFVKLYADKGLKRVIAVNMNDCYLLPRGHEAWSYFDDCEIVDVVSVYVHSSGLVFLLTLTGVDRFWVRLPYCSKDRGDRYVHEETPLKNGYTAHLNAAIARDFIDSIPDCDNGFAYLPDVAIIESLRFPAQYMKRVKQKADEYSVVLCFGPGYEKL